MSDYSYPIDDEVVEWDYYDDDTYVVPEQTRPKSPTAQVKTIYDLAREVVESDELWMRGKTVTIWEGQNHKAQIEYNASVHDLFLVLVNDDAKATVRCARLPMFVDGQTLESSNGRHIWTLTEREYQAWTENARQI